MGKQTSQLQSAFERIGKEIAERVESLTVPQFVPTGLMEKMIIAVGNAEHRIINIQTANKCGKTRHAVEVLKNIFWEPDLGYFDYPSYRDWPFRNDDGTIIKRARILATPQNAADNGPIREEIMKCWPKGRYVSLKANKGYHSQYQTDTGWNIDIMTYEQAPSELEGPMISLQWCDEPPKPQLMGAILSRFSKGGILLLTQTPVGAAFLDTVEELEEKGLRVFHLYGSIYDNSSENGLLNTKGTKRGLMSEKEIEEYVKSIPVDERAARIEGKNLGKSGKIYPMFNPNVHVRDFDPSSAEAKRWNCFMVMDPHDRRYPFIQWWAMTPPDEEGKVKYICYNEYPTIEVMGGYYYERHDTNCDKTPEQMAKIMKIMGGTQLGLPLKACAIDPRFARNTASNFRKDGEDIMMLYQRFGIDFTLPSLGAIETGRDQLRMLLQYDDMMPINQHNEPSVFVCSWCRNTIKSLQSHYWEFGKDVESETYKDPIDCIRIFLALIAGRPYEAVGVQNAKKAPPRIADASYINSMLKALKPINLA